MNPTFIPELNKTRIIIHKHKEPVRCTIKVPASKSESNRALIIDALGRGAGEINNVSIARDTMTMRRLLSSEDHTLDVIDAGTTMRFLTAYLSVTNQNRILTGTPRMCERPIGILVDAMQNIGAEIEYLGKKGYPPIHIKGIQKQISSTIKMKGDVSSQYISAMLMIAPALEKGLEILLEGKVGSKPYISMTLGLMKYYGIESFWKENRIMISPQKYQVKPYRVDPDWSGASYWYAICALSPGSEILLADFKMPSFQGDHVIQSIMEPLGVRSTFINEGVLLTHSTSEHSINWDFSDCPDLAQTISVVCAAKGIHGTFTGLESLRIKETDRIAALQTELLKINSQLNEDKGTWELIPGQISSAANGVLFDTYDDHRMAMALAPLACISDIQVSDPGVVSKSYPTFWDHMKLAGFEISG